MSDVARQLKEETSANFKRQTQARRSGQRKKKEVVKEWYQVSNKKVLKKKRIDNGNVYSVYVGKIGDQGMDIFLKKLKADGVEIKGL